MTTFPAFLDTNAIYGGYLCDTLLRLAEAGTYRPLWSAGVLEELERNLLKRGLPQGPVTYRISQMQAAFPDAEVRGYESLADSMACDKKDRHVLAAAVRANAEVLVTFNLDDFPAESTEPYDITLSHPDAFLLDQLDLYPGITLAVLRSQAASYKSPEMTPEELLGRLAATGTPRFAAEALRHLQPSP
jgi:predicted nucleic acid-binding protein